VNIQQTLEDFKKAKKEFVGVISAQFGTELAKLASSVEGLEEIRWTQYTPYFNDGEACTFRIGSVYFKLKDAPEDSGDNEDGYQSVWDINYHRKEAKEGEHPATTQLQAIVDLINNDEIEDVLYDMYGDHMEVTFDVAAGKANAEEYDHD
jgi:hypothetical protein